MPSQNGTAERKRKEMKKIIALILTLAIMCAGVLAMSSCSLISDEDVVKTIDISLTDELYAFGVAKDDAALLSSLNDYIAKIKGDGTFDAIINKYFGDGTPAAVTSAAQDSTKDQLIVVTNAEFAPFEYKEGDNFFGIDMEIMKGFADHINKELVILNVDFDAVCTTVGTGKADIAAAGLTVNAKREVDVTFSTSYYTASQVIIAKADDTTFDGCTTADDVLAKIAAIESGKIGGQSGTTAQYFVVGDADWGFDGLSNMEWKGYESGALAANDMLTGNIDFVIIDKAPAELIVESINSVN